MPIYAYRCEACGFAKDVLQKMSDDTLTICPSCGQDKFRKQVTAAGFQLKGSGWYVTDFRNGSGGAGKIAPGATAGAEGGGNGGGGDTGSGNNGSTDHAATGTGANAGAAPGGGSAAAPASAAPAATPSPSAPSSPGTKSA